MSMGAQVDVELILNMDLQWFAAEDEGRTEEATEYKIKKAREEGRVAKSQEFVGAVVLLLPALAITILGPYILKTCMEMVRFFFQRITEIDPVKDEILVKVFFRYFIRLSLPIVSVAVVAALFSNLVQTGFLFTLKPLTPKISRIIPRFGQYFQRTLFSSEAIFNLIKSIAKIAVIGIIAFLIIRSKISLLANLQRASIWIGISTIASLGAQLLITAALMLLALSIPDYFFQRHKYRESLKMTKQEVKEERKMYEGDPLIKNRLRQRMRELLSRNMAANVPKADVVITNPTHFAVALEWDQGSMPAPMVTAKGADEVAFRIRRIATENGVPVVENRPLARALFAETEIGDIIPQKYYQAIAVVLAHVYKLNQDRRKTAVSGA